jgi:nucleoside-diphosphate-sugar epimerase
MATLITGGCGFIGLSIAELLASAGEKVVLFDRAAPADGMLSRPELDGVDVVTGDVGSAHDIDRVLARGDIDHVIHTAAMTPNAAREAAEPRQIVEVNVVGTVNLLERVVAAPPIERIVILSSVAVYGFSQPAASGLFEENASPPAPASLYGITKLAAEQAALRIGELRGLDIRVARLGPVYGVWENPSTARDALSPHRQIVSMAREGREVVLPRAMTADWIFSRDAAAGIAGLSRAGTLRHAIYHVGGGACSDLSQWCGIIGGLVPGFRWRLANADQPGNVIYSLPKDRAPLSIARLSDDTGFRPSRSLEAAAREYLAWIGAGRHDEIPASRAEQRQ